MEVDQGLEAVLLAAVEEPVDGPLAGAGDGIGLAVVVEEVIQEIVSDDLAAGAALVAQGLGDEVQVILQGIRAVDGTDKLDKASDDIVLQIGLVGDGDHVVLVRGVVNSGQLTVDSRPINAVSIFPTSSDKPIAVSV